MKILSIDTASNICGVSILNDASLLCNLDKNTDRTHSENLMPMIAVSFKKSNLELKDMDLLVCDIGPGSFTGLRIGVATVKAFKDSLNIPCVGISSLQVLAYNVKDLLKENDIVASIMDCKNNNCYFALYQKKCNKMEILLKPQAEEINTALDIISSYINTNLENKNSTFVGDGAILFKDVITSYFPSSNFFDTKYNSLNSYSLGLAGLDFYNNFESENDILPLYLKKPQAQRLLEEKEKKEKNNN